MKRATAFSLVFVTTDNETLAEKIGSALVSSKLAACVNLLPNIRSIYAWKGVVKVDRETLLVIKTRTTLLSKVERLIQSLHSYEVPEIISVRLSQSSSSYLAWLTKELSPPKKRRIR